LIGCLFGVVVSKKTGDKVEVKKRNELKESLYGLTELLEIAGY